MVLKPAEQTPLTALAIAALAEEAGVPAGVFSVVTGDAADAPSIGGEMTSNPIVRKLGFTGSTEVGKLLMAQCAGQVKKVSLELGGNAPFIVFDDADLSEALAGAMLCKFRNSGQTCISANRFLVQDGIYDDFVGAFIEAVAALKVADGFTEGVAGRAADRRAGSREGRAPRGGCARAGSRAACRRESDRGAVLPAVRAHRSHDGHGNELRGDLRPCRGHQPLHDATPRRSRSRTTRRTASRRTSTPAISSRTWRVAEGLEYGIVGINTGFISSEVAPFGGMKESGIGREGSSYGVDDWVELKYLADGRHRGGDLVVIVEQRDYHVHTGQLPELVRLYAEEGIAIQSRGARRVRRRVHDGDRCALDLHEHVALRQLCAARGAAGCAAWRATTGRRSWRRSSR